MRAALTAILILTATAAGVALAQDPPQQKTRLAQSQTQIAETKRRAVIFGAQRWRMPDDATRCSEPYVVKWLSAGVMPDVTKCPVGPVIVAFNRSNTRFQQAAVDSPDQGIIVDQKPPMPQRIKDGVETTADIVLSVGNGRVPGTGTTGGNTGTGGTGGTTGTGGNTGTGGKPGPGGNTGTGNTGTGGGNTTTGGQDGTNVPPTPVIVDLEVQAPQQFSPPLHTGDTIIYSFSVTNSGNAPATQVSIKQDPMGLDAPQALQGCTAAPPCVIDSIGPNETVQLQFSARVTAGQGPISMQVTALPHEDDALPFNNIRTIVGAVSPPSAGPGDVTPVQPRHPGIPPWVWVLGGGALLGLGGAAAAYGPLHRAWWSRAITVTPSLDPKAEAATGPLGFTAPALGIEARLEPGEAGPKGPVPIKKAD
jgi:hypothetical protein